MELLIQAIQFSPGLSVARAKICLGPDRIFIRWNNYAARKNKHGAHNESTANAIAYIINLSNLLKETFPAGRRARYQSEADLG